jgi:Mg-chelatase subunit ChlD
MTDLDRWRLVLGRYANDALGPGTPDDERDRMEAVLDYLYGREYEGRDIRPDADGWTESDEGPDESTMPTGPTGAAGSRGTSMPTLVRWLGEVRELFPREAAEVIERHALERYDLTELVTDRETLERLQPNEQLLKMLLALKDHMDDEVVPVARRIVAQVTDELRRQLEFDVRQAMAGRLNPHRHTPVRIAANFDPRGTIRRNLKNFDVKRQQIVLEEVRFFQRNARRLPWDIICCVDQSASMAGSVIYSAVMAGILASLPAFRVRLVVFDTNVVDLSDQVDDPVEVLMRVQLGGGTDIAQALSYCSQLIENPRRTVLVLVSDFCEGGSPNELLRVTRSLAEGQVRLLGLAALDGQSHPFYDRKMAQQLADCGMRIAALTPSRFASWLVEVTA